MRTLRIPTAQVFRPLLKPARYKAAFGGRGSGKSHFFGGLVVMECLQQPGTLAVCIREKQMTLAQSSNRLIENKIQGFSAANFATATTRSRRPATARYLPGIQNHSDESIKMTRSGHRQCSLIAPLLPWRESEDLPRIEHR